MKKLLAFGLLAFACSNTPPPAPVTVPPPNTPPATSHAPPPPQPESVLDTKESRQVARTLERVSQLRGVKANKPVPGVKLERDQLVGRIKEKALREYPADALKREGQLLQLFGMAPLTFDYLNEMMRLLEAQLEGFYEPNNGTMYLAADLKGKEAQATLAHELVHALQDQNWDLKSRSTYRPGKGDETLALACLAEGDATSLMIDVMMSEAGKTALDLPEKMMRDLMAQGMNNSNVASVPHILRSTLVAPYIDGLQFVHALRRKGGWTNVDKAWTAVPTTTEQILHPDKWEKHEPALTVVVPSAAALGTGWKLDDEDTFGELGFALSYEEWADHGDARAAAADWGGDRSAVYSKGDEIAFAVHERKDGPFAGRALQKLAPGMKKQLGKPALDSADALCFERKELGPILLAAKGKELVLIAGPAKTGTSWTSSSTCAVAKKWADEVLKQ